MSTQTIPTPATVEVVRHAFMSGAEQMRRNLCRSAYSPVIYEMKDCSVGLYDVRGDLLGQAPGLPFFLGSLAGTIKLAIEQVGLDAFSDGDVWVVNDSAICGSHLNDVTLFAPVFVDGELRGFTASKAHWNDIGAKEAGYVSDSVDIFQEGLRIPPMRIIHAGESDRRLIDMIALNSRYPTELVGDMMAQVTACRTGVERFRSIVARYGWEQVEAATERFFAQAEAEDRAAVASIPDGTYRAEGALDNDGINADPVPVVVTVTIDGDRMIVDLEGSSPENEGSVNSGIVQTHSAIQQAFKFVVNPDAPVCGGNFRNLEIVVPKGSCFDPSPTAACLHYGPHLMLAMDLLVRALSEAIPERTAAGHVGDSWNITFVNERGHAPFLCGESLIGGWGAHPGGDGESALVHSAAGDFKNFPVEIIEQRYPLRLREFSLREGSGGAGAHRGGLGTVRVYETTDACRLSLWFERHDTPSWGLAGGGDGAPPEVWVTRPGGERELVLKCNALAVEAGTVIEVLTGGGGGWGDPAQRSAQSVAEDRRLGLIS
ncbi:hydantoinase B/oxoprolinase family protein [Conexibacter arvalis]|uniref:N-methylhydantoinase B n=1 Tax=Conexibacter arvalis TaxID=912552 RepID=A0A840IAQ1_9ACTN|nr:hydantoinase B/oxoprolinase family protein [Conexibacter arvalis]MBB4661331.1 N-methylhydantoinase B [Conexibacter arvalis]